MPESILKKNRDGELGVRESCSKYSAVDHTRASQWLYRHHHRCSWRAAGIASPFSPFQISLSYIFQVSIINTVKYLILFVKLTVCLKKKFRFRSVRIRSLTITCIRARRYLLQIFSTIVLLHW